MSSQGLNSNFTKNQLMHSPAARKSAWEQARCMQRARKRRVRDWDWPVILMMLFIGGTLVAAFL